MKLTDDSSLSNELPYWEFMSEPFGHTLLVDGSLAAGLKLSMLDIECFDDAEVNQLTLGLRSALDSLSESTSVQFMLNVGSDYSELLKTHAANQVSSTHELIQEIAEHRMAALTSEIENKALYKPELSVFIRTEPVGTKNTPFWKRKTEFSKLATESYEETLECLSESIDSLAASFESLGLKCERMTKEALTEQVYRTMNPKRADDHPTPEIIPQNGIELDCDYLLNSEWLANASPREQLVFGDLILNLDQFVLDGHTHKVVTLKTLPEVTFAGQMAHFLRLPFHYTLLLSFHVPPQASEFAKLQQKRKMAHSMALTSDNRASDLESETKLSSTEELIRELLATGQRIYSVQMTLILKAPATPEGNKRLSREVREVLSRLRSLQGAEGLEESVGSWKVVKGNLPAAPLNLERARKMKTSNLADFLPIYGPRLGDSEPVVLFRNRLNGLVSFNPFDPSLPNYNALVTGSSGAGKSFLNNCILLQELAKGLRVFIIDIGGSYKKLTEALDGQYLEMNLSDQYKLNPFHLADPKGEPSNQKLKSLLAIIECMVAENDKTRLAKLDRALLEKAIIDLYKIKRETGEIPTLSDLALSLSQFEKASIRDIAKMLYLWTGERPYGRLLDGQGGFDTRASICTFDLKGLSAHPDLQSVMILILTDFILSQIETDQINKKRIILDEAWELLKSEAAANFMEYCARTLRKTGSGITFITQGVEEIVASPIGAAILNNTATKFVMLQRGDSELLAKTLKLNFQELNLVNSLQQRKGEFSEGFMIEGDSRQVIRVFPSPLEYWLSTSDAQDNSYIANLRSQGLNLAEAVRQAARDYPSGVSATKVPR